MRVPFIAKQMQNTSQKYLFHLNLFMRCHITSDFNTIGQHMVLYYVKLKEHIISRLFTNKKTKTYGLHFEFSSPESIVYVSIFCCSNSCKSLWVYLYQMSNISRNCCPFFAEKHLGGLHL